MKAISVKPYIGIFVFTSLSSSVMAFQKAQKPEYSEVELKENYQTFLQQLDFLSVADDYPKIIEDLLSGDPGKQKSAVNMLGESREPKVIPWLVPFLDSDENSLRIRTAAAIENIISKYSLKRRDLTQHGEVVLRPIRKDECDLRPFAWIALKMFRMPDDGSMHAYAATITRYLELRKFEDELRHCLQSKHPAVSNKAEWALESLGLENKNQSTQAGPASNAENRHGNPKNN